MRAIERRLWRSVLVLAALWAGGLTGWAQTAPAERVVRMGVYDNPPKIFADSDGQANGVFGALARELAALNGWRLQVVPCEWQDCLSQLEQGQLDLMPDVAYSDERAARFAFHHEPVMHSWSQVYQHKNLHIESVLDLRGLRVAVLEGGTQKTYFESLLTGFGVPVKWVPESTLAQAFQAVAEGRADVVLSNHVYGEWQAHRHGAVRTPIVFQPSRLFFAAPRSGDPELLSSIDAQLVRWKADRDSFYHRNQQLWGNGGVANPVPLWWWWALGLGSALLSLALAAAYGLRRKVQQQIREIRASEERLNTILDSVDVAIFIKDPALRYQYVNRAFCEVQARARHEIVGQTAAAFLSPEVAAAVEETDRRVLQQGERVSREVSRMAGRPPQPRTYRSLKLPLRTPDGQIYALCGIATDVTELRRQVEEIHLLAFFDPLTGLPNRRLFIEQLHAAHAASQRTGRDGALIFIDLDHFKLVNDTRGHEAGDQLLKALASRLQAHIRDSDVLARLGGDEFVLLLRDLATEPEQAALQAQVVADKVQQALRLPFDLGVVTHEMTASLGIALFSDARSSSDDLLRWSDMAMYEAKLSGRNATRFFNPAMQDRATAHVALEQDIRHALAQGQFVLHYQPQVDVDGQLCGVEALARWQHPSRGLLSPAHFIQVAEETGLIVPLGQWALHTICRDMASWQALQPEGRWRVAVNLSAKQFHHPDFVRHVTDALESSQVDPGRVELELTESLLLDDVDQVVERMRVLQGRGVLFSLDDFGTGYSSLGYLRRLPLYKLKIDQSFVRDLGGDGDSASIVRTIVALADSLGLETIAEGVEQEAQRDRLAELGCIQYQGYYFSRPIPRADFEANWLRTSGGAGC
jgi:diguanylate cyclase (GGDEF)-like protein/PAS domain S-box-containing protein